MYTLLRTTGVRTLMVAEAPALVLALITAELFYKFHSFLLECAAFLATWAVVSWAINRIRDVVQRARSAPRPSM